MRFSNGMDSVSRDDPQAAPTWPSEDLLLRLRKGKAELHAFHAQLPLPEKVRLVMKLQRIVLPLIARQRPLHSWEKPWEIEP